MGYVSQVLSSDGIDVKTDRGSGDNVTAQHFSAPGDDATPLPGDYAALSGASGTGRFSVVAYRDAKNPNVAAPGEKRIYSRDGAGGIKAWVHLKNDGSFTICNETATIEGSPDGTVVINGVIIPADGSDIILANGKSLMHHKHPQSDDSAGNSEADTGETI